MKKLFKTIITLHLLCLTLVAISCNKSPKYVSGLDFQKEYEFNVGEYDSTIAFFVKRGFTRVAAESTAIAILSQAKIDNVKPGEILDIVGTANPVKLDELVTIILNANRFKTSRLGVRQNRSTRETVSRNIID